MHQENLGTMRSEVTSLGIEEIKTANEIDEILKEQKGTLFLFVNSVCGCSAGSARPSLRIALKNSVLPEKLVTVFAGQDREATAQARKYITEFAPSSPSMFLFRDGKVVHAIERWQIEGRSSQVIAEHLMEAFNEYCEVPA